MAKAGQFYIGLLVIFDKVVFGIEFAFITETARTMRLRCPQFLKQFPILPVAGENS
jgi:hypothetical protein